VPGPWSAITGFACRGLHANRRSGINNNGRQAWTPGNSRFSSNRQLSNMSRTECGSESAPARPRMNLSALLAEKVADGFNVQGVPTSERTARLCVELGVPLYSLDDMPELDLTIDGADEMDGSLGADQGRRRRAVARKNRRLGIGADDRDCRRDQTRGHARPVSAANRGCAVRHDGDAARGGAAGVAAGPDRRISCSAPTRMALISPMAAISSSTHLLAAFRMQKRSQTGSLQFPAWSSTDCFSKWQAPQSSLRKAARGPCLQQTLNRSETEHDYSHRSQAFRRRA
jgi:hypothetical protein